MAILATHHHPDHVGGIAPIARELGLPLWAHAETAAELPELEFARLLEDEDEIVLEGPAAERWTVLHTPGHAWGHVCLWEEDSGTVVVGDMVATVGTILVAPGDGDMRIYLEQLARLEATIMFEELLRRYTRIESAGDVERMLATMVPGVKRMPIRLGGS